MENNNINNTNTINKKAMLFISLSIIIPAVIRQLGSIILPEVLPVITIQGADSMAGNLLTAAVGIIEFILILIFCSKLTDNRRDAIHFLGIYAMGGVLGSIVTSALDFIHKIIFPSMSEHTTASSLTMYAMSVIGTVASVIFTCLLYNILIEKNTLHSVSFADSSKIKKNMIFAYISVFLAGIVLSGVIAIIPVLESTGIAREGFSSGNFVIVLSEFIGMLTTSATFGILYFFGFRHSKNRNDALNFASCYYFPSVFTLVISSFSLPLLGLFTASLTFIEPMVAILLSLLTSAISIAIFIVGIMLTFCALRQIFPVQQIAPTPYPAEETYTDNFYVEPSHIENVQIPETDIAEISNDEVTEQ